MLPSSHSFTMQLCLLCYRYFDDWDRYTTVHQQSIMQSLLGSLQELTWFLGLASSWQHQKEEKEKKKKKKEHHNSIHSLVIKGKVYLSHPKQQCLHNLKKNGRVGTSHPLLLCSICFTYTVSRADMPVHLTSTKLTETKPRLIVNFSQMSAGCYGSKEWFRNRIVCTQPNSQSKSSKSVFCGDQARAEQQRGYSFFLDVPTAISDAVPDSEARWLLWPLDNTQNRCFSSFP